MAPAYAPHESDATDNNNDVNPTGVVATGTDGANGP